MTVDLIYQVTGLASVVAFAGLGLAVRRALENLERRRHHGQGRRR